MRAGRALQPALPVHVGRVLLDPGRARQHDVRRLGEIGQQHALHDQVRQLARPARVHDPRHVADRALRARIEHVQRLDRARPRPACGTPRGPGRPRRSRFTGKPEIHRAHARSARRRRDLELDVRRLRLVARGASETATPSSGTPSAPPMRPISDELFERGMRRDEEAQRRGAAGGGDPVGDFRDARSASRSVRACRPRCAAAAAAAGRPLRSSDSRSGRCRTSSSC